MISNSDLPPNFFPGAVTCAGRHAASCGCPQRQEKRTIWHAEIACLFARVPSRIGVKGQLTPGYKHPICALWTFLRTQPRRPVDQANQPFSSHLMRFPSWCDVCMLVLRLAASHHHRNHHYKKRKTQTGREGAGCDGRPCVGRVQGYLRRRPRRRHARFCCWRQEVCIGDGEGRP